MTAKNNQVSNYNYDLNNNKIDKLIIYNFDNILFLPISSIIRCMADKGYTYFYLDDGSEICASRNIHTYEKELNSYNFIKPHKSHLINILHIKCINKSNGAYIVMSNDSIVPIASRKKKEVFDLIKELFVHTE